MATLKTLLFIRLCILYVLHYAFINNAIASDASTVRFAVVLFRHGDRAPFKSYPFDPYRNFQWVNGWGQLTPIGMMHADWLGAEMRNRLHLLFPSTDIFSSDDIYVRSSDRPRCVTSAQYFLHGFLSMNNTILLPTNQLRPIEINIVPLKKDRLISQAAPCPKYDRMLMAMMRNPPPDLRNFIDQYRQLFQYMSAFTGKRITSIYAAEKIFDTLSIEKGNGLILANWTNSIYAQLLTVAERAMAVRTENDYMKRVKGGNLLATIIGKLIAKRNNRTKRRMFVYSGHDTTLLSLFRVMNIVKQTSKRPGFSACFTIELHENQNIKNDYQIKMFYFKNPTSRPRNINIPNCRYPCSLNAFIRSVNNITVNNIQRECRV